jgi:hypothetical protein
MINIYKGKIKKLYNDDRWFFIEFDDYKFKSEIKNGTVDVIVKNNEKTEVGIKYLEIGDMIKIISQQKSSKKKYIIPKKIYINTKYSFYNESSDSEEIV